MGIRLKRELKAIFYFFVNVHADVGFRQSIKGFQVMHHSVTRVSHVFSTTKVIIVNEGNNIKQVLIKRGSEEADGKVVA